MNKKSLALLSLDEQMIEPNGNKEHIKPVFI